MAERAMFKGVINLIIKQDDKVLLFFRNDGFFNDDGGWWVLPAGHIEQGETAMAAAIREAKEELDIDIAPDDIKCVHAPAIWPVAQNLLISFSRCQNTPAQFATAKGTSVPICNTLHWMKSPN